jgi:hypothetical protein
MLGSIKRPEGGRMKDTELYAELFELGNDWVVTEVKLDSAKKRVDVWVKDVPGRTWKCAVCGKVSAIHDYGEEQSWRHLDTCQ